MLRENLRPVAILAVLSSLAFSAACAGPSVSPPTTAEASETPTPIPTETGLPATKTPAAPPEVASPEPAEPSPFPTQLPSPSPTSDTALYPERLTTSLSTSPDGQWTAESWLATIADGDTVTGYDTRLVVSQRDGSRSWSLAEYRQNAGLGLAVPEIVLWSADGQRAYFTNRTVPDGCGALVNGSDLYRADLETGQVTEVMPALARALALSPDESQVAYFPWGPAPDLVVRDLASGTERRLKLEPAFEAAGGIVWSPDDRQLALTLLGSACLLPGYPNTIVLVDVPSLTPTILLEDDVQGFVTSDWPEEGRILLQDVQGNNWSLDPASGEIQ